MNVTLKEPLYLRLKRHAMKNHSSIADVIRGLITEALKRKPKEMA